MTDEVTGKTVDIVWEEVTGGGPLPITDLAWNKLVHERLHGDPSDPDLCRLPAEAGTPGPEEVLHLVEARRAKQRDGHRCNVTLVVLTAGQEPVRQDRAKSEHEKSADNSTPRHATLSTPRIRRLVLRKLGVLRS